MLNGYKIENRHSLLFYLKFRSSKFLSLKNNQDSLLKNNWNLFRLFRFLKLSKGRFSCIQPSTYIKK